MKDSMKQPRHEWVVLPPLTPGLVNIGDQILAFKRDLQSVEPGVVGYLDDNSDAIGVRVFDTVIDTIHMVPNRLCLIATQPRLEKLGPSITKETA